MTRLELNIILAVCKKFTDFYNTLVSDYCIGIDEFKDQNLIETRKLSKKVQERCQALLELYEQESDAEVCKQYLNYFSNILNELGE